MPVSVCNGDNMDVNATGTSTSHRSPQARQWLALTLAALQFWQPLLQAANAAELQPASPGVSLNQAANGVPVVNIASPNASGLSHNSYTQFNVGSQGLILNNSAQPVNTQLGGYVMGNANMAAGSARLILNEVTAPHPSQLQGYMEVAGQKAGVIVANPWGITCNGCGFINTAQATLSAGRALLDGQGALSGFEVQQGRLRLEGSGLNASNTDRLALYGRVLELNAALHARDLQIVTGQNQLDKDGRVVAPGSTQAGSGYSIDSSALGGMYAKPSPWSAPKLASACVWPGR